MEKKVFSLFIVMSLSFSLLLIDFPVLRPNNDNPSKNVARYMKSMRYTKSMDGSSSLSSTNSWSSPTLDASFSGDRVALLTGVSDYNGDGDTEDGNDLHDTINNIEKWKSFLELHNFDYEVLLNENASAANIKSFIHELKTHEDETSDQVLFMWTGHGDYTNGESTIELGRYQDVTSISESQLNTWFSYESWQSEHMLYVFDSCHSGGMEALADHDGSFVATSSRYDESSFPTQPEETGGEEYGVFTYYFLVGNETAKGLMGGQCTEYAFDYAQLETIAYVNETYNPDKNPLITEQHPVKAKDSWSWWIRGGSIVP